MKLKHYLFAFFLLFILSTQAQVHEHAIGIRGGRGGFSGYGPELSYQLGFNEMNRLELDFGWYTRKNYNNGIGWGSGNAFRVYALSGIYHWDWNIVEGLNWFVGPGAQVVFYDEKNFDENDGIYIGLGGQIGLEYDFSVHSVPLHLGLDYRPMFLFTWNNGVGHGTALSLRYLIN